MGIAIILNLILTVLQPAHNVEAFDTPNDAGGSITIRWKLSPDDPSITRYEVYRVEETTEGTPVLVGFVAGGRSELQDNSAKDGVRYFYFVRAWSDSEYADSEFSAPAVSKAQWFHTGRKSALFILIIYAGFLLYFLNKAKRGIPLYIRHIAGLDAVEEAVGRSTEMGRPILFILGLEPISNIATLAGLAILKRVASKVAEYETSIIVPCFDPVVMVAAQEVVKEGFLEAGRPDLYDERQVFYLTYDQFGYAAGVDGIMLRDRPGAVFLQGYFYAESLILAETGHSIGAIQISGTTAVTQLPFFIAATDYTLIGEEMYAASAYLSKDPMSLGTIKGEDVAKVILVVLMVLGVILETLYIFTHNESFHILKNFFKMF
jgi:hypothetical protein